MSEKLEFLQAVLKVLSRRKYSLPSYKAEMAGNRYKIEILMSRMQKLKGLPAASLRLKKHTTTHPKCCVS